MFLAHPRFKRAAAIPRPVENIGDTQQVRALAKAARTQFP